MLQPVDLDITTRYVVDERDFSGGNDRFHRQGDAVFLPPCRDHKGIDDLPIDPQMHLFGTTCATHSNRDAFHILCSIGNCLAGTEAHDCCCNHQRNDPKQYNKP